MSAGSTLAISVPTKDNSVGDLEVRFSAQLGQETTVLEIPLPESAYLYPSESAWDGSNTGSLTWTFGKRLRFFYKKYARFCQAAAGRFAKRTLDILVSLTALILLSPLFFVVALLIKLTDGGSILFWQKRVGRHGRTFAFPKFRSMVPHAETMVPALLAQNDHKDSVTFKMRSDPRITWIGKIIRKLSVDELPQLWCVLKGEMTLVGPRPPVPREVAKYSLMDRRRLEVTPGLTCIWQVSGRGTIPFPEQVAMDVHYIDNQSLFLDLKILLQTVPAVLLGRGAF